MTIAACATPGCGRAAAFKTRTRPAWCEPCIDDMFRAGGLEPTEAFSGPRNYRRTKCLTCTAELPYRFEYVLDQNVWGVPVCRVCHWRKWGESQRATMKSDLDTAIGAVLATSSSMTDAERDWLGVQPAVWQSVVRWWWPTNRTAETLRLLHHEVLFDTAEHNDGMSPVGARCSKCGYEHVVLPGRLDAELTGHWCLCQRCHQSNDGLCPSDVTIGFATYSMTVDDPAGGADSVQSAHCERCASPRRVSMRGLNRGLVPCYTCDGAADPTSLHRVYIFHFPAWRAMKVGITNSGNDSRLDTHRAAGGQLIQLIDLPHRAAALFVERSVLDAVAPWPPTGVPDDRPIAGRTEMWDAGAPITIRLDDFAASAAAIETDPSVVADWKAHTTHQPLPTGEVTLRTGDSVCFTGTGPGRTRLDWQTLAEAAGLKPASTVTASVSALVAPEDTRNSKVKAAARLGVPVITYGQFEPLADQLTRRR